MTVCLCFVVYCAYKKYIVAITYNTIQNHVSVLLGFFLLLLLLLLLLFVLLLFYGLRSFYFLVHTNL